MAAGSFLQAAHQLAALIYLGPGQGASGGKLIPARGILVPLDAVAQLPRRAAQVLQSTRWLAPRDHFLNVFADVLTERGTATNNVDPRP